MKAIDRPHGWYSRRYGTVGRLTGHEFDLLEALDIDRLRTVTSLYVSDRFESTLDAAQRRLQRMYDGGLFTRRVEVERGPNGNIRRAYYTVSDAGHRLYREAYAALDARCEEAA